MSYEDSRSRIIEAALEMTQKQASSTHQNRCKIWLRDRYREVIFRHAWDGIRIEKTFSITDGTPKYALPQGFFKIFDILNASNVPLRQVSFADLDAAKGLETVAGNTYDSDPLMYEMTIEPIHTAIPATGTWSVVAGTGDDDVVTVIGLVDGIVTVEAETLVGATPVDLAAGFTKILGFHKNADTANNVLLKRGTTEVARLYPKQSHARCLWVNFFFTPDADATFTAIGAVNAPKFDSDDDILLVQGLGPYLRDVLLIDVYREDGQIDKSMAMEVTAWDAIDKFFTTLNPKATKFTNPRYAKFG